MHIETIKKLKTMKEYENFTEYLAHLCVDKVINEDDACTVNGLGVDGDLVYLEPIFDNKDNITGHYVLQFDGDLFGLSIYNPSDDSLMQITDIAFIDYDSMEDGIFVCKRENENLDIVFDNNTIIKNISGDVKMFGVGCLYCILSETESTFTLVCYNRYDCEAYAPNNSKDFIAWYSSVLQKHAVDEAMGVATFVDVNKFTITALKVLDSKEKEFIPFDNF